MSRGTNREVYWTRAGYGISREGYREGGREGGCECVCLLDTASWSAGYRIECGAGMAREEREREGKGGQKDSREGGRERGFLMDTARLQNSEGE